jgi:hypothetical protein
MYCFVGGGEPCENIFLMEWEAFHDFTPDGFFHRERLVKPFVALLSVQSRSRLPLFVDSGC